jgi:Arc/MetJ-type ribon-helix-helix transcriptional regulator
MDTSRLGGRVPKASGGAPSLPRRDAEPMPESKVTVKIPRPLYERIQQVIEESGFSSATDFIVFVLRDLVGDKTLEKANPDHGAQPARTNEEIADIRRKLHNLGYL